MTEYDYKKLYDTSQRCEALYSALDPGFLKLVRQWGFAQVSEIMADKWQDQIETYQEFIDASNTLTERELLHIYELSGEELKSRAGL